MQLSLRRDGTVTGVAEVTNLNFMKWQPPFDRESVVQQIKEDLQATLAGYLGKPIGSKGKHVDIMKRIAVVVEGWESRLHEFSDITSEHMVADLDFAEDGSIEVWFSMPN
jgi:hypothetical protein